MNRRIRLFQLICFTNLISVLGFLGIFIYKTEFLSLRNNSGVEIIGYSILLFVLLVYVGNFYFGLTLISKFAKEFTAVKSYNGLRVTFIVLEIITALLYTALIIFMLPDLSIKAFWPLTFDSVLRALALLLLFLGYFSSLLRLFLTKSVTRIISLQEKKIIEQFGSESL